MECCENCVFSMDYGESVLYIKCERKRRYVEKKQVACKDFALPERKAVESEESEVEGK